MATTGGYVYTMVSVTCDGGGGSDTGGNVGSDFSTGPHGGGGSDSSDPCINLKNHLSTTTGVKLKSALVIPALQETLSQSGENGKSLIKDTNGAYSTPPVPTTTDLKIKVPYGGYYFGSIHTHPYPGGVPMFSWTDLFSLQLFLQEATTNNYEEVVIFLVCKDNNGENQTYALKVADADMLYNAIIADISTTISASDLANMNQDDILQAMDEKLTKLYTSNSNKELAFLDRFASFGISLYKTNSYLTNWGELTVQNQNTPNASVLPIPCK